MNGKLMAARLKHGWSMKRAADAVRVGYRTWRYWEVEGHDPSLDSLRLLMDIFGCSAEELGYGYLVMAQVSLGPQEGTEGQQHHEVTERYRVAAPLSQRVAQVGWFADSPDSTTWYSERVAQIISLVYQWRTCALPCTHLQQIMSQEFMMFENYVNPLDHPEALRFSRRHALTVLAALPVGMLTGIGGPRQSTLPAEEFLPSCTASITACWHLMAGRDFAAVERALSQYFSLLVAWAQQSSPHQRSAAHLAAQGYLLLGLVSLHQLSLPRNFQQRFCYCQQAVKYAKEAGDPSLLVASLIHLGGAAHDLGQLPDMLRLHQQALLDVNAVSPLLQSKLYAETAYAYARNGQIQAALSHLGKARDLFPGNIADDAPSYLATDYGLFSLILFEGQTLLEVGQHESDSSQSQMYYAQAQAALAQIEQCSTTPFLPERFQVEIANRQTITAVKMEDLEQFRVHMINSVLKTKALGSVKRQQEVLVNWKEARKVWPHEPQVTALADLLLESCTPQG